ncbi:MAG: ROK family transcriptional regulator [Anaerolineales bacterium]|nr:ROK family transcriptional regulator [Anaerolineales bacterium]
MIKHSYLGSNINLVKEHNRQAILLSLLRENHISRVQLARMTSLSTTTITNLVTELIEQGVVIDEGSQAPEGSRGVGRPRSALRLVPEAHYAIGVHIGIGLFRVAVADLSARMICNKIHHFDLQTHAEDVLDQIVEAIEDIITCAQINRRKVIGVGVGASGLVNYQTGVNILAPNLGWHTVPIRAHLQARLNLPVEVDNNVRAMALGEAFFGLGRGSDSLAFVYGRIGVGAGFVFGGEVFRGSNTGAGEIGHTIIMPEGGEPCRCGKYGCLETLVSEPVLVRQAQALAEKDPGGMLAAYLHRAEPTTLSEKIFEAARHGDLAARGLIDRLSRYLGIALANLVNTLNPQLILLGGVFAQGQDLILPPATQTMREVAFAGMGEQVQVKTSSFGWSAGVIGAAALALTRFFYQQSSQPTEFNHPS